MVINGINLIFKAPIKEMIPFKRQEHGVSHGLSEVGYDIRIKQEICFSRMLNGKRHVGLESDQGAFIEEGSFVIASSMEEFEMPTKLMGIVHDKSTWARRGLSVFNTVIEPGWKGFLTLELVYHGQNELIIPAGSGIAQVVFHAISSPATYNGKYQNQEDRPVPAIAS